ncbi:MAG TPA: 2-C-methyl-D-erythritol 2,4-cyclodiphosphate synthase [Candidatus Eremiobacteraceae bacterium]|nr:2-C-methyl-D-erythritol 2,4-cyclodiphosphate synthase [Candidatus Eremiobacteraceae bacterium]
MRAGLGYDAHPLVADRPLILAGVEISFGRGLEGFSDADVVAHAVIDAILGAAALGDCGTHFPSGDAKFAGARSVELLHQAVGFVSDAGFAVGNVDCTIVAERPSLAPYVARMRDELAAAIGIEVGRVSVKAKRTEGLGFTGSGDGIEAYAIALLEDKR